MGKLLSAQQQVTQVGGSLVSTGHVPGRWSNSSSVNNNNNNSMESAEEEQHVSHSQGLKQKCRDLYNKSKFPITLEPVVFFFTLSVGLNEVNILSQMINNRYINF